MSSFTLGTGSMVLGLCIILLGIPAVHERTIARLQKSGYLPPPPKDIQKYEIIPGMGPRLTMYTVGIFFILLGIFLWKQGR